MYKKLLTVLLGRLGMNPTEKQKVFDSSSYWKTSRGSCYDLTPQFSSCTFQEAYVLVHFRKLQCLSPLMACWARRFSHSLYEPCFYLLKSKFSTAWHFWSMIGYLFVHTFLIVLRMPKVLTHPAKVSENTVLGPGPILVHGPITVAPWPYPIMVGFCLTHQTRWHTSPAFCK
jgi:hypothetical protein